MFSKPSMSMGARLGGAAGEILRRDGGRSSPHNGASLSPFRRLAGSVVVDGAAVHISRLSARTLTAAHPRPGPDPLAEKFQSSCPIARPRAGGLPEPADRLRGEVPGGPAFGMVVLATGTGPLVVRLAAAFGGSDGSKSSAVVGAARAGVDRDLVGLVHVPAVAKYVMITCVKMIVHIRREGGVGQHVGIHVVLPRVSGGGGDQRRGRRMQARISAIRDRGALHGRRRRGLEGCPHASQGVKGVGDGDTVPR